AQEVFAKAECFLDRAGSLIGARIGGDTDEGGQYHRRYPKTSVALDDAVEPGSAHCVLWHVAPKRINQDVDVRQDHLNRFIRSTYSRSSISCSADRSGRSIPGIGPPVALLMRGRVRFAFAACRSSATIIRRPSSISEVRVRPSAAALRLARLSNSSGRRIVVRSVICQDILSCCIYVNRRVGLSARSAGMTERICYPGIISARSRP